MALALENPETLATGDGVTVAFATGFTYRLPTDVEAWVGPEDAMVQQTYGVAYVVTGASPLTAGGTVTFLAGHTPANGALVLIRRATPPDQPDSFGDTGTFRPSAVSAAMDRTMRVAQEAKSALARSLSYDPGHATYNAAGRGVRNLADGSALADAVTLSQVQLMIAAAVGGASQTAAINASLAGKANLAGGALFSCDVEPYLLALDAAAGQVSIGEYPVNPYTKFWVVNSNGDMTVNGQITGHNAIAARMDCTGAGTAAINPVGIYGTLWLRPAASAHFNGQCSAVKGNAYTINRAGVTCDVDLMTGVYGRSRHEAVLGTIGLASSFFADSAQKGAGAGAITEAAGVVLAGDTLATKNYGILLLYNNPNGGMIAAKPGLAVTLGVNGGVPWTLQNGGNVVHAYAYNGGGVLSILKNNSAGVGSYASFQLQTATAGSVVDFSLQDNGGAPFFLATAPAGFSGFHWNANLFDIRSPVTGVPYHSISAGGVNITGAYSVAGTQVVGARGAAVANATGAGDVVAQLNLALARMRSHGLIAP